MSRFSRYLFPEPTWAEGAGRILDFGDFLTDCNYSASAEEADDLAMRADWLAVYGDLNVAVKRYSEEKAACLTPETTPRKVR